MFRYLLFPVLNALGSVLAAFAALMLVPALYSWAEGDGAVWDFLYSVGITFAAGTILFFHLSSFSTRIDRAPWLFTRNALLDTHQRFCDDSTAFKSTSIQLL